MRPEEAACVTTEAAADAAIEHSGGSVAAGGGSLRNHGGCRGRRDRAQRGQAAADPPSGTAGPLRPQPASPHNLALAAGG